MMKALPEIVLKLTIAGVLSSSVLPDAAAAEPGILAGTARLEGEQDRSAEMLTGIDRYFDRASAENRRVRELRQPATTSSREEGRAKLGRILGVASPRPIAPMMISTAEVGTPHAIAESARVTVQSVRWRVYEGVHGEGLLLQPKGLIVGRVVAIPDAGQTPEELAGLDGDPTGYALRLAESGCQVLVPTIVDRTDTFSGSESLGRFTNQPHREWIYRQAYTFGRHIIGYEIDKIRAALDWFETQPGGRSIPIAVAGWGEGGLLAFYSAALDTRIHVALVSGYFEPREVLWQQPIYRNLFGLLREFGDAEVAALIPPRRLLVEDASFPAVDGPPPPRNGKTDRLHASAAPGVLRTPEQSAVKAEFQRAKKLARQDARALKLLSTAGPEREPLREETLQQFLSELLGHPHELAEPLDVWSHRRAETDPRARQKRQVAELERYTQGLIETSRNVREDFFWKPNPITTPAEWDRSMGQYRKTFWEEVMGRLEPENIPLRPRSRIIHENNAWTAYEVVLDALPDISIWGYLLVPRHLAPGERRPVIVTSHGGGGVPSVTINRDKQSSDYHYYKGFAAELADRGYVVFSTHFPWRGGTDYRALQRKANPLGKSVFSVILAQHDRLLDWLTSLAFVDSHRIGLYGLSWGGKVALRVPAVLDRYSLAICSGDFNEWIWKNATTGFGNSFMFVPEYEMFDFNLGMTFGYGEMAAMIAPRAFMVERGHGDGVGIDEWVAFEYAKVNRLYNKLRIPEQTAIEYFDGRHEIWGNGTFTFIQQHFRLPAPPIDHKR